MTNEEAFKEAKIILEEKTWFPSKWAFEMPMKVAYMCVRINQAFAYSEWEWIPETYNELLKKEKEMKKHNKEK